MAQGSKFWSEKYANVRQPEIDHIRKTGKNRELGTWDSIAQSLKYNGTEIMNDLINDGMYGVRSIDADEYRTRAFNEAKKKALQDYQDRQQGIPTYQHDVGIWNSLGKGQYDHK
jgi:hypothetical protein